MEKLAMCRICLVENVIMYEVANKDLQEMYEKLTDVPFVTLDWRPMLACFFCYAKLKQCCQLLRKCLNAEEVFAQMLNGDYEQVLYESRRETECCGGFIKTSIEHWSIHDVCQKECGDITEQLPAVCDIKDEIELKEEYLSVVTTEEEVEYPESYPVQEDTPSHPSESDSEDDVPLMIFKTVVEEEQEVPEKDTRAPVAKKPKLDIRKAKLEDTITDKQKKTGVSDSKMIYTTRNETSKSVTKFREPVTSDSIAKHKVNSSTLDKGEEIIKESLNNENVKEVIETAMDTNDRYNSNQDHFGCKTLNDKGQKHKNICKPYTCDICQHSFKYKSNLNGHICIHTGKKPYKCDICQGIYKYKSSLNEHIRTHTDEKPYKCNVCQHSFTRKPHLESHHRTHTGEKPYKCDVCQRSFTLKSHLKLHHRTHTGEKPYKCDVCQRSFTQKPHLDSNHHTHTGEKPYKCDLCQRCFTRKDDLKSHHRTHTVEKPYKCDVFKLSFYLKSNLKTHHRTHTTGEKPYKCDVCHRCFTRKGDLKSHHRTHW